MSFNFNKQLNADEQEPIASNEAESTATPNEPVAEEQAELLNEPEVAPVEETAAPIAAAHKVAVTTDERLIEAANVFEGKPFGVGDGVLRHPGAWRHLWNPWRPSWGEPYDQQINRMLAAVFAAREAADGKDAICVSHQLPIWILRSAIENRRLLHDPRKRECSLASVTSIHFDDDGLISGLTYSEPARHLLPGK